MQKQLNICSSFAAQALQKLPGLLSYLWPPSLLSAMGKHMCPKQAALCWLYRNPPRNSGYAPQRWVDIPALVGGRPLLKVDAVRKAVRRFHKRNSKRGRPTGWRKTAPLEDKRRGLLPYLPARPGQLRTFSWGSCAPCLTIGFVPWLYTACQALGAAPPTLSAKSSELFSPTVHCPSQGK